MIDMEDEFTAKMHSEFTIHEETDQKLRAGTTWGLVGFDADEVSIRHWAELYGTTYETCMKWKSYWRTLHENSK